MALLPRRKTAAPQQETAVPKDGGKGRATPSRKQAQAARPVQPYLKTAAGAANRKERGKFGRQQRRAELVRQRTALKSGDLANLPARDRGPERALARDIVDARRAGVLQTFPVIALLSIVASFVHSRQFNSITSLILLVAVVAGIGDAVGLTRKIARAVSVQFPESRARIRLYAVQRAVLPRRLRLPPPKVQRGRSG